MVPDPENPEPETDADPTRIILRNASINVKGPVKNADTIEGRQE
jgi:ribosomal protein S28E/S33